MQSNPNRWWDLLSRQHAHTASDAYLRGTYSIKVDPSVSPEEHSPHKLPLTQRDQVEENPFHMGQVEYYRLVGGMKLVSDFVVVQKPYDKLHFSVEALYKSISSEYYLVKTVEPTTASQITPLNMLSKIQISSTENESTGETYREKNRPNVEKPTKFTILSKTHLI